MWIPIASARPCVLLTLLGLFLTTVTSQRQDEFCARRKDGLIYPDSEDCRAYVYCSGGIAYRSQCLAGLYYEPSLQACEFDNKGKCYENEGRRLPPPRPRPPLPPSGGYVNNFLPKLPAPERGATVSLDYEKSFDARAFCSARPDGTYSHPTVCTGYLLCSNQLPFEALCPDNLVYSDVTGSCDYDYIGICSNSVKSFPPSPSYNRPFKSITLSKSLSLRLAELMPRAIERALVHLTQSLQREAELAATFSEPFEESFGKHKRRERPFKLVQRFLKAKPLAKQLSMTAFVINNASEYLTQKLSMKTQKSLSLLHSLPSPLPHTNLRLSADDPFPQPQPGTCPWPTYSCLLSGRYRSFDGSCNNVQHPLWGRAFIPLKRLLPPVYQDGQSSLRASVSGVPLPSARRVSVVISEDADHPHHLYTLIGAMQWGQFMDHDLDLTAISTIATEPTGYGKTMDIECGSDGCDSSLFECEPIRVAETDPVFKASNSCLEFVRSEDTPNLECKMGPREQLNQITSYLDASQVYGSSKQEADALRDLTQPDRGKLKITPHPLASSLKSLLPRRPDGEECEDFDSERRCFSAGDSRVNEQMGLTVMHTVWLREHNRIEEELHRVNPGWGGERLYQEARRVLGAMMQHITFNEFLPIVLGPKQLKLFGLELLTEGYFSGYDMTVDASTANVFATAAFRFGHSLLQPWIQRADRSYNTSVYPAMNLSSILNRPKSVYDLENGGVDGFIRGLSCQPIQQFDRHVTKQLTAHLFTEAPPTGRGNDLVSLNIQRGRDHGLPGYNAWRDWCGLRTATNFDDMMDIKETRVRLKMKQLYNSVDDVDLFPAGISELPVEGGLVGPTFSCIIARQFQSLRKGDRFWYENDGAFRFSPEQMKELRKVSLARVLCNNGDHIDSIQPRVMERPFREVYPSKSFQDFPSARTGLSREWFLRLWDSDYNARLNCSCIEDIDFSAWKMPS